MIKPLNKDELSDPIKSLNSIFIEMIIEIFDLDELIELNQKLKVVRDCMKRFMRFMFISDECKSIHQIILQLLNLCNRCKEVWKLFNLQANSHIFLNKKDERNRNLERKLRKENHRKKQIKLEQYSLIDEEIDSIKTREEEEREEVLSDDQSSIPFSLNLTSFVLQDSQDEEEEEGSVLDMFQKMNLEFERLICLLKREIGSLTKRSSRKENLKEEINVENEEGSKGLNLEEGIEDEEDGLECVMLLECKLNEWIP
ncbi:hypothetical protein DFH28DRAFT_957611 [Melampsora americana]|nr:hypothetical protein DFH28DRAFT_957611 [Melampsora americana]